MLNFVPGIIISFIFMALCIAFIIPKGLRRSLKIPFIILSFTFPLMCITVANIFLIGMFGYIIALIILVIILCVGFVMPREIPDSKKTLALVLLSFLFPVMFIAGCGIFAWGIAGRLVLDDEDNYNDWKDFSILGWDKESQYVVFAAHAGIVPNDSMYTLRTSDGHLDKISGCDYICEDEFQQRFPDFEPFFIPESQRTGGIYNFPSSEDGSTSPDGAWTVYGDNTLVLEGSNPIEVTAEEIYARQTSPFRLKPFEEIVLAMLMISFAPVITLPRLMMNNNGGSRMPEYMIYAYVVLSLLFWVFLKHWAEF